MINNYLHSTITNRILRAYYNVYNKLGYGFLEKVYENALMIELKKLGLQANAQVPIKVFYDEEEVGYYIADLVVEGKVIVEIKAAEALREEHEAQLVNYLRATEIEVGVLINFGKKPELRRKVFSKEHKS